MHIEIESHQWMRLNEKQKAQRIKTGDDRFRGVVMMTDAGPLVLMKKTVTYAFGPSGASYIYSTAYEEVDSDQIPLAPNMEPTL